MNADLIGATIEVVHANNKTLIGKKGKVLDETKNTITINTKEKKEKILKTHITFKIHKDKKFEEKIINGKTITKRPYERIRG